MGRGRKISPTRRSPTRACLLGSSSEALKRGQGELHSCHPSMRSHFLQHEYSLPSSRVGVTRVIAYTACPSFRAASTQRRCRRVRTRSTIGAPNQTSAMLRGASPLAAAAASSLGAAQSPVPAGKRPADVLLLLEVLAPFSPLLSRAVHTSASMQLRVPVLLGSQ